MKVWNTSNCLQNQVKHTNVLVQVMKEMTILKFIKTLHVSPADSLIFQYLKVKGEENKKPMKSLRFLIALLLWGKDYLYPVRVLQVSCPILLSLDYHICDICEMGLFSRSHHTHPAD